jgi:hypothetical protein
VMELEERDNQVERFVWQCSVQIVVDNLAAVSMEA